MFFNTSAKIETMNLKSGLPLLYLLLSFKAFAQEEYDDIPPPPIMEEMDEDMIEEVPPDEYIDGPVYNQEEERRSATPPSPAGDSGGGAGFSSSRSISPLRQGRDGNRRINIRPSNHGGGKNNFGESDGKLHFQIVEGEFWEKGKKRGRKDRD